MAKEADIQRDICRYLRKQSLLFWRFSPDTYNAAIGRYIKHEYVPNGLPDIMVLLPNLLLGLEVKGPKGKASPDQVLMQKRFKRLGHVYKVVRSVEEVCAILSEHEQVP